MDGLVQSRQLFAALGFEKAWEADRVAGLRFANGQAAQPAKLTDSK
jgi:hypothetical protein